MSWRRAIGSCGKAIRKQPILAPSELAGKTSVETYRRKKWKRSVTNKNFFLPWKNAPLAREISGVSEYSEMAANEKSLPSCEMFFWR
jgi:hypothetical protein